MIKSRDELKPGPIEVDLHGPEGNAFYLLALASKLIKRLGIEYKYPDHHDVLDGLGITEAPEPDQHPILREMKSGDYDHLVKVFDDHFGDWVILYR